MTIISGTEYGAAFNALKERCPAGSHTNPEKRSSSLNDYVTDYHFQVENQENDKEFKTLSDLSKSINLYKNSPYDNIQDPEKDINYSQEKALSEAEVRDVILMSTSRNN